jgi:hypothetical protein
MKRLESLDQLRVGTRIKIVAKCEKFSVTTSVKKLIKMWSERGDGSVYGKKDTEVLVNRTKNHYFSMNAYLANDSQWVKEVYVLDGTDRRLRNNRQPKQGRGE